MQHPNTNSIILLPNFTMNIHLLVHQTSQTFPSKIHVSIPSSFDTMKFSISWNWSLVHTEYSTLILDRLCRKHTETQEGRYSVLVSSLLSFSGVGWVDLWLSQEVRLDDGSQSGGEVNLPPPFEETYVPPLPFFPSTPYRLCFGETEQPVPEVRSTEATCPSMATRGIVQVTDGNGMRSMGMIHGLSRRSCTVEQSTK